VKTLPLLLYATSAATDIPSLPHSASRSCCRGAASRGDVEVLTGERTPLVRFREV
jgi:hypothetical protein